jgi:hypothetical protein
VDREEDSVFSHCKPGIMNSVTRVACRYEMLISIFYPFDRHTQPDGGQTRHDFVRIEVLFGAKSASDITRYDTDLINFEPQNQS